MYYKNKYLYIISENRKARNSQSIIHTPYLKKREKFQYYFLKFLIKLIIQNYNFYVFYKIFRAF